MKTAVKLRFCSQIDTMVCLLVVATTLAGCVTRGYKMAPQNTPPATALNLPAAPPAGQPAIEARLQTVIVYKGPGSWKREAYWDEYVISIANRGPDPLVITGATLHPTRGDPVTPGDNPWEIEKVSKKWWQSNAARQGGTYLALGAGATAGGAVVAATIWSTTAGATAAATAGVAAVVALPVVAVGTVYANQIRKHQVVTEFTRRRLVLPLTIAPGATAQGSLFFRITPAPRRLALACQAGAETQDLIFDLSPLARLHLKEPAGNSTSAVNPSPVSASSASVIQTSAPNLGRLTMFAAGNPGGACVIPTFTADNPRRCGATARVNK